MLVSGQDLKYVKVQGRFDGQFVDHTASSKNESIFLRCPCFEKPLPDRKNEVHVWS